MSKNEDRIWPIGIPSMDECSYMVAKLEQIDPDQDTFPFKIYSLPENFLLLFKKRRLMLIVEHPEHIKIYLEIIKQRMGRLKIHHDVTERVMNMSTEEIFRAAASPLPRLNRKDK